MQTFSEWPSVWASNALRSISEETASRRERSSRRIACTTAPRRSICSPGMRVTAPWVATAVKVSSSARIARSRSSAEIGSTGEMPSEIASLT